MNERAPLEAVALLPSVARGIVRNALRFGIRPLLERLPLVVGRRVLDTATAIALVPRGTSVAKLWLRGVPAERVRNARRPSESAILYVHGGGFCTLRARSYRALAARLARAAAADVYVIDYRRAPEDPYPAACDDAIDAYRWLLRNVDGAERISIVSDSAGCWIALAALARLRDDGVPLPASVTFVSPWIDLERSLPKRNDDAVVSAAWLARCAAAFGGPSLDKVDLAGFPRSLVIGASADPLLEDARRLAIGLRHTTSVIGKRYEGLWHDFPVQAGLLPEADHAIAAIADFVRLRPSDAQSDVGVASNSSASEFMQNR